MEAPRSRRSAPSRRDSRRVSTRAPHGRWWLRLVKHRTPPASPRAAARGGSRRRPRDRGGRGPNPGPVAVIGSIGAAVDEHDRRAGLLQREIFIDRDRGAARCASAGALADRLAAAIGRALLPPCRAAGSSARSRAARPTPAPRDSRSAAGRRCLRCPANTGSITSSSELRPRGPNQRDQAAVLPRQRRRRQRRQQGERPQHDRDDHERNRRRSRPPTRRSR